MIEINVYDFDGTIYSGDSTVDFYFYCLLHNKKILKKIPLQLKGIMLYILKRISKKQLKEYFYTFLQEIPDVDKTVKNFWEIKQKNIKQWYLEKKKPEDIVISASPTFLLKPICLQLGIRDILASIVDKKSGKYIGENCKGKEKVTRFFKKFPGETIEEFYSDTDSDEPLAYIAQKSYRVKGEKITEWKLGGMK